MKKNKLILKTTNLIFFLLTLFVNFLANFLPLNGINTGGVSALYENPFTPAPFTFSIWGIIYLLLAIFVVYQLSGKGKINKEFSTGPYFIIASLANCSWIFLWHYQQIPLSFFIILILSWSVFQIFKKLDQYNNYSLSEYLSIKLPFSIYAAWVTSASIANFMVLLKYLNPNWPKNFLAIVAAAAILLALYITIKILEIYKNIAFALVIIWTELGIITAQLGETNNNMIIIISAAVSIVIIISKIITSSVKSN